MRKNIVLFFCASLILSACIPFIFPTPIPAADFEATSLVFVEQSLQAQSSPSLAASQTPTIATASPAATQTQGTVTATLNPILLTLTATLGTGTIPVSGTTTAGTYYPPAVSSTPNLTSILFIVTPTGSPHPQFYGTLPPYVPSGKLILINRSKAEAYISLQVTTTEGLKSILEYPVQGRVISIAPAGKYFFVAWVGGKKMTGSFRLDKNADLTLTLMKDKVVIGK